MLEQKPKDYCKPIRYENLGFSAVDTDFPDTYLARDTFFESNGLFILGLLLFVSCIGQRKNHRTAGGNNASMSVDSILANLSNTFRNHQGFAKNLLFNSSTKTTEQPNIETQHSPLESSQSG